MYAQAWVLMTSSLNWALPPSADGARAARVKSLRNAAHRVQLRPCTMTRFCQPWAALPEKRPLKRLVREPVQIMEFISMLSVSLALVIGLAWWVFRKQPRSELEDASDKSNPRVPPPAGQDRVVPTVPAFVRTRAKHGPAQGSEISHDRTQWLGLPFAGDPTGQIDTNKIGRQRSSNMRNKL